MNKYQQKFYGVSPGPCDRLGCRLDSCYGWDYCRQAREVATHEDWELMKRAVFGEISDFKEDSE